MSASVKGGHLQPCNGLFEIPATVGLAGRSGGGIDAQARKSHSKWGGEHFRCDRVVYRKPNNQPRPPMQRKLAAILSADVVGYSGLMEVDEAGTLERLKANRMRIFDPHVTINGGRLFK